MGRDRKTVLVVEDDPDIASLLRDLLEEQGYRVVVAGTGARALALVRTEHPTIITLDLMLPHTSGQDVLDALAADPEAQHIPVVVASAFTERLRPTPQVKAVEGKPFDLDRLVETVTGLAA